MASGMNRLQQMKIFNMLTQSFNQYQLNQLSQLLYANQACVPEATPVPGFESRTAPSQFYNQREACYPGPTRKTFMDDLSDLDFSDVSTLFDGTGVDDEHLPDPDRMFECFDEEEGMYDACPLACVKEEAKSPSPCDSACSMQFNSPPYSPCMSDAEASIYSTDDGFHSDSSVDELFDAGGSPASFSDEAPSVDYSPPPKVKEECIPPPVPHKPTGRRKRGPKPPAMYSGNGPIQLWQFLLELIVSTDCKNLIRWTQEEDFEFKILKPTTVANLWGKRKNKPTMNYEKLSRGLRYYYGKSIIEKVHGKRYVYQFICNIPEILGYNPMDNKQDELVEDSVCGEPEMSPEVEDLLVTSSAVNDLLPESFDLSELLKL